MKIGIDAMLNSLDPYTNYFSEAQVESYRFTQEGKITASVQGIKMMDGHPPLPNYLEESPVYKTVPGWVIKSLRLKETGCG